MTRRLGVKNLQIFEEGQLYKKVKAIDSKCFFHVALSN